MSPWIPWFEAEAFSIAGITFQPFGLIAVVGTLVAMMTGWRRAAQLGIPREQYVDFLAYTIPVGYFLGNVYNVLSYHPEQAWEQPWLLLMPWNSQGSFGGVFGAIFGGFLWKWKHKAPVLPVFDACAFGFVVFWAFGRTGCFVTHDHPGQVSDFFLAVKDYEFGAPPYLARHDLGLYEMLWSVAVSAYFHWEFRRSKFVGFYAGWLAVLYAPIRFYLDFLRVGDRTYGGLTPGQYAAVALLVLGWGVLRHARRERRRISLSDSRSASATS